MVIGPRHFLTDQKIWLIDKIIIASRVLAVICVWCIRYDNCSDRYLGGAMLIRWINKFSIIEPPRNRPRMWCLHQVALHSQRENILYLAIIRRARSSTIQYTIDNKPFSLSRIVLPSLCLCFNSVLLLLEASGIGGNDGRGRTHRWRASRQGWGPRDRMGFEKCAV